MTTEQIKKINEERLGSWQKRITEGHATAAVLVAIGHDQNSGQFHICIPTNLPLPEARAFLAAALKEFDVALKQEAPL